LPIDHSLPAEAAKLPCADLLRLALTQSPPGRHSLPRDVRLDVAVLARRKGERSFEPVADGAALASEVDDYRIAVRPSADGCLYLFQVDTSGAFTWLFPQNLGSPVSTGSNPVAAGRHIFVPSADAALYLDRVTGVEHIYAVFCAQPWPELEQGLSRPPASPLRGAGPSGRASAGLVQSPLGLCRGVGGARPLQGESPSGQRPFSAASGADGVLVVERWLRHVDPR
jgi:hypothetical protein